MNTYLINAEAYHILDNEVKKIVKDNNYLLFNMHKTNIPEIINEANYLSLDSNKKYIVVSNADFFGAEKLSDEDSKILLSYISNPNINTILIFTTQNGIDSRKKIVKEIKDKKGLINVEKYDRKKYRDTINEYLKKYNYEIDYDTINYIIDNSYENLDIIINELDKIMIYYNKPCKVNIKDITLIVGEKTDNNNFHFVSAVIDKDLKNSLKLLKDLKVYKVEANALIVLLAREYRLMYYVKKLFKNASLNEICNNLGLQDWQVKKLYNNGLKYSEKELLSNLVDLCNIDMNIKKGLLDKDTALYNFLLNACL